MSSYFHFDAHIEAATVRDAVCPADALGQSAGHLIVETLVNSTSDSGVNRRERSDVQFVAYGGPFLVKEEIDQR